MKVFLILGLFLLYVTVQSKLYEKCELAKQLKKLGMDGYKGHKLENWMCLAKHESNYNTRLKKYNQDDKRYSYGIFQISSHHWCKDGKTSGAHNRCGVSCNALLQDNIAHAVACVKKIAEDESGLKKWTTWQKHCTGKNLAVYTHGCRL